LRGNVFREIVKALLEHCIIFHAISGAIEEQK